MSSMSGVSPWCTFYFGRFDELAWEEKNPPLYFIFMSFQLLCCIEHRHIRIHSGERTMCITVVWQVPTNLREKQKRTKALEKPKSPAWAILCELISVCRFNSCLYCSVLARIYVSFQFVCCVQHRHMSRNLNICLYIYIYT